MTAETPPVPVTAGRRRAGRRLTRWHVAGVVVLALMIAAAVLGALFVRASSDLDRTRSSLAAADSQLAGARADAAAARAQLATAKASLGAAESQVSDLRSQFANLRAQLVGLQSQAASSRVGTAAKDRTIADLNTCLDGILAAAAKFKAGDDVGGTVAINGVDGVCNRAFNETQQLH